MNCPSCHRPASADHLVANKGVCASCVADFQKRHGPHGEANGSRHQTVDMSHAAFVDGHLEPVVEFPFAAVEDALDGHAIEPATARAVASGIAKFAQRLFEVDGFRSARKFFQAAHAFAFACGVHPNQDQPGEAIAKRFGITKAGFFKQVNHIRDRLDLPRIAEAKNHQARKTYSRRTKLSHAKKKKERQGERTGNDIFFARFAAPHSRARA